MLRTSWSQSRRHGARTVESETTRDLTAFETNAKKQVDSLAGQFREEKDQRANSARRSSACQLLP